MLAAQQIRVIGNENTTRSPTPALTNAGLQAIQTVFVILMENENWSAIQGSPSAPYINGAILPMASYAEQYYNPPGVHPSLPNYLWLEAGTNFNIADDNDPLIDHQSTTNHLVTQLKNAGIAWRAYEEDICGCYCPLVYTNQYAPRHNPFVYFDDVTNTNDLSGAYCIANIRSYAQLAGDLQNNTVARYNFITPNSCDDMHDNVGCATGDPIKNGDTWLSTNLPLILSSQAYSNSGAVFIVWEEAEIGDGPIGMIVLSPLAKGGGYSNSIHYTHSSMLRTIQEIFNVSPLLGDAANANDLSDLFNNDLLGIVPPVASFAGNPTSGAEPLAVTFTDISIGSITNRFWSFGDGSTTNTTATTVAHTYQAGTYGVTLIESGPAGVSTNAKPNFVVAFTAFQAWQIQYFGGTNNPAGAPNADPDGDGQNNLTEFLAGTNPTNNASVFRLTGIKQEGDNIRVTWAMGSGKTNALQVTLGDPGGGYTDLFTISNTVGRITDYVHVGVVTSAPVRYYRVRLLP